METQTTQPEPPATRPRRRFWKRALLGLLLLAVLLRIALPWVLPSAVRWAAAKQGLDVRYETLDLSLWKGELQLGDVTVKPHDADQAAGNQAAATGLLSELEFLALDVDVSALFTGTLRAKRVEVDGLDLFLRRADLASGWAWEGLPAFASATEDPTNRPKPKSAPAVDPDAPFQLGLGFEVDILRLQHLQVHLRDEALTPPLSVDLECNVRLSDLGVPEQVARLEVFAHADRGLGGLAIDASLLAHDATLQATGSLDLRDLEAGPFAAYLAPLGLEPRAQRIDATASFALDTQPANEAHTALKITADLTHVVWRTDGVEQVALDSLHGSIPSWTRQGVRAEAVQIQGVRARAGREATGALLIGGFAFQPVPAVAETEASIEPPEIPSPSTFALDVPSIEISNGKVLWQDAAVQPNVEVALELTEANLGPIQRGLGSDPPPIDVRLRLVSPGLWESLELHGSLQAFGATQGLDLTLAGEGVTLGAIEPYLASAGLQPEWQGATLALHVQAASSVGDAGVRQVKGSVRELSLQDGSLLGSLGALEITGLQLDPTSGDVHLEELHLAGTELHIERDAEGIWHVLGVAIVPATQAVGVAVAESAAPDVSQAETSDAAAQAADSKLELSKAVPEVRVDRVLLEDYAVQIHDQWLQPNASQEFRGGRATLEGLWLGGEIGSEPRPAAHFDFDLGAQDLAESLRLQGTLQAQPGPLDMHLLADLVGSGMRLDALAPWLPELGIESLWKAASCKLHLDAQVRQQADGTQISLALEDLALEDQGTVWVSLGALRLPAMELAAGKVEVPTLELENPYARVQRNAAGELEVMGLRLLAAAPSAPKDSTSAEPAVAPEAVPETAAGPEDPKPATQFHLGTLRGMAWTVDWIDQSVAPTVETQLVVDLGLDEWHWPQGEHKDGQAQLALRVAGSLEQLTLASQVHLDPSDLGLSAQLAIDGLRAGPLAAYLPPTIEAPLAAGQLRWNLQGHWATAESGGQAGSLTATDLVLRDGPDGEPLLALDRMALEVPRFDWEGGRVELGELALQGLRLPVQQRADGSWSLLGLHLTSPPADSAPPASAAEAPVGAQPTGPEPLAARSGSLRLPKIDRAALPTITLDRLDVGLQSLRLQTEGGQGPIELELRLHSDGPLTLLAPEPEALAPIELIVSGAMQPLVDALQVHLQIAPYAATPGIDLNLQATGIHGDRLPNTWPMLASRVDASAWTAGEVGMHLSSQLDIRRRSPLDFPLDQGFGLHAMLDQVHILAHPEAEAKLGFEELSLEVDSIQPATGQVRVRQIDWSGLFGDVLRDAEGLHVADLVLLTQPEAPELVRTQPADTATVTADEPAEPVAPSAAELEAANTPMAAMLESEPASEVAVDSVVVSGGRFQFEDRTVDPALVFPLQGFDLEVKRFSTRTLVEERPFRFQLSMYGGDVELPKRSVSGNLVSGLLGSVASVASAAVGTKEVKLESRPAFDEFNVRGNLSLGPQPKGWVQARIRGFELPILRGFGKASGVEIKDGLLDEAAMVHMNGAEGVRISSTTNFSYLSLSEPVGGPISSYLKLPAPLDTVLYALKDKDGDQTIPLNIQVQDGGVSTRKVLGAVTSALGNLILEAIASTPMRVLGGVIDLAGLDSKPVELTGNEWVRIPYAPGEQRFDPELRTRIEDLVQLLRRDPSLQLVVEQGLGSLDVERANVLANPDPESYHELAQAYRRERNEGLDRREALVAQIRMAQALGRVDDAQAQVQALRELDAHLAQTESALDRMLEFTQDLGERAKQRRGRDAALQLARRRQELVGANLRGLRIPSMGNRLDLRRPRFLIEEGAQQGFVQIAVQRRR
ncbi:MAG: DUF748 domain-containing protein [Planctomycetes bacterium]|nr:DUF748 domain-containing protein [Planctomycetota bacterium]